jgi:predicted RNase H-like nuclease (RuvC/YqgF family)
MTTATDTDIQEIKTAIASLTVGIEANTKATAALTLEIQVGFANVDTKFAIIDTKFAKLEERIDNLETKLEGKINTTEAKLIGKIDQLDERTKLGFCGFIFRGTALAASAALTAIFVKYLFPILPTELPKL